MPALSNRWPEVCRLPYSTGIGIVQSNHVLNQLNLRFTSLESSMNTRFGSLEGRMQILDADMKTLVHASNDLDVRLARLEERLAR